MIEIREEAQGYVVQGAAVSEIFSTKIGAIFAACGLAAEHAAVNHRMCVSQRRWDGMRR